jgi:glycogen synthase
LKEEGAISGFIRTVHHLDHFDDMRLSRWQHRAWRDADRVLCVSEMWTCKMRRTYGVEAMTVSNGIDATRYGVRSDSKALKEKFGIGEGPVVLAVGGIEERKNTLMLLDAFAMLRTRKPSAQLVLAGGASLLDHDAYARRFFARATEMGLETGAKATPVVIAGPLDDAEMPALYQLADVVSMISLREGFGLVVLEALASGRPVVVSNIAPFTEYLDARTCVFANPQDASDIATALNDPQDIDFDNAVPALLERFTWQASARRHLDIYRQWLAHALLAHH